MLYKHSRKLIAGLAFILMLTPLAGCTTPGNSPSSGESTTLNIIARKPGNALNPLEADSQTTYRVLELIYDTLLNIDKDGNLIPGLAESWDVSDDGLVYTLKIRANLKFSDGSPLTSEDVIYTMSRWRAGALLSSQLSVVSSVEAVDKTTVKMTLSSPDRRVLDVLAHPGQASILSKAALEAASNEDEYFAKPTATSGGWTLEEYREDDKAILVANPHYWNPVKIDKIVYTFAADSIAWVAALESGTADLAFPIAGVNVAHLKGNPDFVFHMNAGQPSFIMWLANWQEFPLNDVRVRQAIAYMLPRETAVDVCWGGAATASGGSLIPPGNWARSEGHDPYLVSESEAIQKASDLLSSAGWVEAANGMRVSKGITGVNDGTSLAAEIYFTPDYVQAKCAAQLAKNSLAGVGFDLQLRESEWNAFEDRFNSAAWGEWATGGKVGTPPSADMDMLVSSLGMPTYEDTVQVTFHSQGWINPYYCKYDNPQVDAWIDEARSSSDLDVVKELYGKVQDAINEDLPCFVTGHQMDIKLATSKLQGFWARPDSSNKALYESTLNK